MIKLNYLEQELKNTPIKIVFAYKFLKAGIKTRIPINLIDFNNYFKIKKEAE